MIPKQTTPKLTATTRRALPGRKLGLALGLSLSLAGTALAGEIAVGPVDETNGVPDTHNLDALSKNLPLDTALYLALAGNFQIRQAQERVIRQTEVIREARGALLPALTGSGSWNKLEKSLLPNRGPMSFDDTEDWGSALEVSQTIFAGGSDWAFLKAQTQILAANKAELQALINETALGVRVRFYDAQLSLAQIGVQEDLVELREAELKNAQNRLDAGVGSNFEALRARVAVSNSRPELIRARNTYELNLQELRRFIGLQELGKDGLTLAPSGGEGEYDLPENVALDRAAAKRPEIAQLSLLIDAQKSGIRVEVGRLLPLVEVYTNYQVNKAPENTPDDTLEGFQVGVRSTWNIFDGGQTKARIRQAQSDLRAAELNLDELRLNIEVEVRRAYSGLINARELMKASEQTVTEAEESLRLANSRLEVGAATQLDILDSQLSLTQARTNRIQAQRDLNVAIATLRTAVGEGVRPDFILPGVVNELPGNHVPVKK